MFLVRREQIIALCSTLIDSLGTAPLRRDGDAVNSVRDRCVTSSRLYKLAD